MIRLDNVTKIYPAGGSQPVRAVHDLSLAVKPGEFVVITGRSGSGKTTVLNLIGGLTRQTSGSVELDGLEFGNLSDERQSVLRNRHIGFVFQFPSLLPSLTVQENVLLPAAFGSGSNFKRFTAQAESLLEMVGLTDKLGAFPRQLSAGQQQRVVIARSLINQPKVLLADEPTSNLDEQTENEIIALLERIHREQKVTILMVTHTRHLDLRDPVMVELAEGRLVSVVHPPSPLCDQIHPMNDDRA
jgi:ABC-type lipoprotein export system ATPase subunit